MVMEWRDFQKLGGVAQSCNDAGWGRSPIVLCDALPAPFMYSIKDNRSRLKISFFFNKLRH